MKNRSLYIATLFAILLAFIVIVLGAYTRLTDAGLGCPDWPGCYGKLLVSKSTQAAAVFAETPLAARKAWTEMIHRYVAGSLGLVIFGLCISFFRSATTTVSQKLLTAVLVLLVIFQALLGMWTVTLKLFPVVVMAHLLGGLLLISGLRWLNLSIQNPLITHNRPPRHHYYALIGLLLLIFQIALGGWVSANYAGLACVGFPACNGQLLPPIHFIEPFNPFLPLGLNYEGGILDSTARISIHMTHRIGAVITASYLLIFAIWLLRTRNSTIRKQAMVVITLVIVQFCLGILNVVKLLPLSIAVAHNAVAALLLLTMITVVYYLFNDYDNRTQQATK